MRGGCGGGCTQPRNHPNHRTPIPTTLRRFGSHDEDKMLSIANAKLRPLLPPLDNASMMSWGSLSSFGGSEARPRPPSRVPTPENLCQYGRYQVLKRRGHSDGYDVTYSADHEAPGIARMLTTPQGRAATPMEKSGWADDPVWLCEVKSGCGATGGLSFPKRARTLP